MRGIVTLAYGVLSYLVFFLTFLYAIGFIGNFMVPKSLDSPPIDPWPISLAIDLGLLTLFALQHSVMARRGFKKMIAKVVPEGTERSTYVLASSLALILLFWQWRPLGGVIWDVQHPLARALLFAGFAFGWALVLVTTFVINHFDLFGLRQSWRAFRGLPQAGLQFATPALYRVVRHPLYVGWFFAFWSTPTMTVTHLLFAVMTTAYILVAIRFEERDLMAAHPEYEAYRRQVPMLVPRRLMNLRRFSMNVTRSITRLRYLFLAALTWVAASSSSVIAQEASHHRESARVRAGALVNVVRESTERFHDVQVADKEGYHLMFGCVSGPDAGAMGMHFVNLGLATDAVLDPTKPEIVIYEPMPGGRLRLVGADFLVFKDVWDAAHPGGETPQLMGQLLHLFDAPNRFGLPPFYTLHVWAWKESPTGTFVNWHSKISCDAFTPQSQ